MSILVLSLSHRTAPMDLLGRLAMDVEATTKLVSALCASEYVEEAVVLSTCNRLEVYASVSRFHAGLSVLSAEVSALTGVSLAELQNHCGIFYDEAAVSHCFSVASGLDSMVAGEHQILGQVRQAYSNAQAAGTVGTALNGLFQQSLRVAKRVQTETAAGSAGRSVMTSGTARLAEAGIELAGQRVLVVGAGSMAALAARTAAGAGARVCCVNRTPERAQHLAGSIEGTWRPWSELTDALAEADVLITCTGARGLRIGPELLIDTPIRGVLDLALPADVDPDVADLPGITLVSLEVLAAHPDTGADLGDAVELVAGEVRDFQGVRRAAAVTPTVVALRTMASEVVAAELRRLDARRPGLDADDRQEIEQTVRRVVEKLLHQPTVRVKEFASVPESPDYALALRELFALDAAAIDALSQPR